MKKAFKNKGELIEKLIEEFRRSGFDGASLSQISSVTGLGKASLYHYFPGGKEEMALEVTKAAHSWIEEKIVKPLLSPVYSPTIRVREMTQTLSSFYLDGSKACLLEVMAFGTPNEAIREEVKKTFKRLLTALEKTAIDAGLTKSMAANRSEQVVAGIQGCLVLARGLGDKGPFKRQMKLIENEFLLLPQKAG